MVYNTNINAITNLILKNNTMNLPTGKYKITRNVNVSGNQFVKNQIVTISMNSQGTLMLLTPDFGMFVTDKKEIKLIQKSIALEVEISIDDFQNMICNDCKGCNDDSQFIALNQLVELAETNSDDLEVQNEILNCVNYLSNRIKRKNRKYLKEAIENQKK